MASTPKKKSQQHRRPEAAPAARTGSTAAPSTHPVPERATLRDLTPREDVAAAARQEGDPTMLVAALIGTTLFMAFYLHGMVLQQMTQFSGGLAMPDSLLLYGQDHVAALAAAMDEPARGQLNWVHKTAGVIFSIAVALTLTAVAAWRLRPAAAKWGAFGVGVAFVAVQVAQNIAIESAIAAGGAGAGTASALTALRWAMLAAIAAAVVVMLVAGRRRRRASARTTTQG